MEISSQLSIDIDCIGVLPTFVPAPMRDKGSAKHGKNLSNKEKFNIYIQDNPTVWQSIEALALEYMEACKAGYMFRFSIAQIVEDLRSKDRRMMMDLARKGIRMDNPVDRHSEFSIGNNYKAHFSRLLIDLHPEMKDYLTLREMKVP